MKRILFCLLALTMLLGACGPQPVPEGEVAADNPARAYYDIFLDHRSDAQDDGLQYLGLDLSGCMLESEDKEALISLVRGYCEERGLLLLVGTRAELAAQGYIIDGDQFPEGQLYWFVDEKLTGKKLETTIMYHLDLGLFAAFGVEYTATLRGGQWQVKQVEYPFGGAPVYKPVIYLYPQISTQVDVTLTLRGSYFTETTPPYGTGWHVLAQPDGQLTNLADGKTYPYLFWEAITRDPWPEPTEGFIVARNDLRAFLREKLAFMGLIPAEYEEFIEFWVPMLSQNEYSFIYFAGEEYTSRFPLEINPAPDSLLRVFMIARPATGQEKITPQVFQTFTRTGFVVIEWGGTLVG